MTSCLTCPSRLAAGDEQVAFLGKKQDFGAAICGRYGYILERPGQSEAVTERIAEKFASRCSDHGAPLPDKPPDSLQTNIGLPLTVVTADGPLVDKPSSCTVCTHFIPATIVEKELGWTVPMCGAMGKLLAPARLVHEATVGFAGARCPYGEVNGSQRQTTEGVIALNPIFEGGVAVSSMVTKSKGDFPGYDPMKFIGTDPREYETDLPVSAEHAAAGIRAWRLVPDPKGMMEPVAVPIFNGEKLVGFDPRDTYGEHTPHLYLDHQGLLYTWAAYSMGGIDPSGRGLNKCLALTGPAGTGKTEFFAFVAWLMDLPLHVISCRPDMSPFELIGGNALTVKEIRGDNGELLDTKQLTQFVPGRFLANFDQPCVIVLDEFASLPDEAWFALRGVFVGGRAVTVEEHGITKSQGSLTFIGLATNPDWDPAYRGVRPLSPADKQRFPWLEVSLPDENTERKIIRSHCEDLGYELPADVLDAIMLVSLEIREMIRDQKLELSWGIRMNVSVAQASWMFSLEDGYRTSMMDALDPHLRDSLMTVVKSHTG